MKHKNIKQYIPLHDQTRSHISTDEAAFHLNREPQTLRSWSCLGNGPIKPIRIGGRLVWSVSDIKILLSGQIN